MASPSPLITVVTVVLNDRRGLEYAVTSVEKQNYGNAEHLVIDGSSTDGTLDLIQKYAAEGVIDRFVSEPDEGISDAFNKGICMARGDLVGLLNADDRYLPGALEKVADAYRQWGNNTILHGNILREGRGGAKRIKPRHLPGLWKYVDSPFNHPATFVPRAVYDKVGLYDTRYRLAMDYDFYLRAMLEGVEFCRMEADLAVFSAEGRSTADPLACHREVLRSQKTNGLFSWLCRGTWAAKVAVNRVKGMLGK